MAQKGTPVSDDGYFATGHPLDRAHRSCHTSGMAKRIKPPERPTDVNPLANYLVNEAAREGGVPDAQTKAQVSLLMAETKLKGAKKPGKTRLQKVTAKERKAADAKIARARSTKRRKSS